jgi:xanthine/CO dehydrogenase XdhC/CoxF family maturation factor
LFERERAGGRACVLAVVLSTQGSTYRKAGSLMLIDANGEYAGLLSGGCLESDLLEHAKSVLRSGTPASVNYDLRGPDDLLWGLGLGCEGAMQILLLRVDARVDWQPLAHLAQSYATEVPAAVGIVTQANDTALPYGQVLVSGGTAGPPTLRAAVESAARDPTRVVWYQSSESSLRAFILPLALPPRLLLLGAGPDAAPVVEFAARLHFRVTLADHRPAYVERARFPSAHRVDLVIPDDLAKHIDLTRIDAAVVMSHHVPSDLLYLRALALSPVPYIGLLGPRRRRDRLLAELSEVASALQPRLHAPVGLALGGETPEAIALSIVAEVQAVLSEAKHAESE